MNVYNDTGQNSCQVNLLMVSSLIAANTSSYNCICSSYQSKSKMRVNPKRFTFLQLKKNCPSFQNTFYKMNNYLTQTTILNQNKKSILITKFLLEKYFCNRKREFFQNRIILRKQIQLR